MALDPGPASPEEATTARKTPISTGREPTGLPTGTGWPVLNETSFSTGQNARY